MDFSTLLRTQHHALVFSVADRVSFLDSLKRHFEDKKYIYEVTETNVLDIDTARELKAWSNKSYGSPKIMILSFHTITVSAQNALLKVLEEPQKDSKFILITSHIDALLPTVRSRLSEQKIEIESIVHNSVKIFLKTTPNARMKLGEIEELLVARDNEDRKDREKVQSFISNLLEVLIQEKVDSVITKEVASLALYASDPSSSAKSLLEYVSLRVPRIVC